MSTTLADSVLILDPSELYRPEKKKMGDFRLYSEDQVLSSKVQMTHCSGPRTLEIHQGTPQNQTENNDPIQVRVRETYRKMHTHQTMEFVQDRMKHWTRFDKAKMTVMDALRLLNCLIDESDPDVNIPNIVHAFQTAERIRAAHPNLDWFHLTGLVHDLGKVMALWGEPQWAVVGDTFVVGCEYAPSIVYRETSFQDNPDLHNEKYNTRLGIYKEHCGLENVTMSWGHDEYMYQVLKHNKCTLPEEALYMIRYHSFYPWHLDGHYKHIASNKDEEMLKWVQEFNKFDLYSKSHEVPDVEALIPYYQSLVDKYMPGVLEW